MDEKELNDDTFWDEADTGKFKIRLNFDYDEWMRDKDKYQLQFQNEVSKILDADPGDIKIAFDNYSRGSTIFDMIYGNGGRKEKIPPKYLMNPFVA